MYSTLSDESSPVTEWATGGCRTWSNLQHGCKSLIAPFADLAEKLSLHVSSKVIDPSCKEEKHSSYWIWKKPNPFSTNFSILYTRKKGGFSGGYKMGTLAWGWLRLNTFPGCQKKFYQDSRGIEKQHLPFTIQLFHA